MNRQSGSGFGVFVLLTVAVPLVVLPMNAVAAERVVLSEMFTQVGCPYCNYAGPAMEDMLANYPDDFLCLQYHIGDSYATTESWNRFSLYNFSGTPSCQFDGTIDCRGAGSVQSAYDCYEAAYLSARSEPSDTELSVTAVALDPNATTYRVYVQVCVDSTTIPVLHRQLHIAQALDHLPGGSHWRNTFVRKVTPVMVSVPAGECAVFSADVTITGESLNRPDDIRFFAWVQGFVTSTQVVQAAMLAPPFPADCNTNGVPDTEEIASGGAADCNTNGVPDSCDIDCGASLDDNGNSIPDECEAPPICLGDSNCDGAVNWRDIDYFVAAQGDNVAAWEALFDGPAPCDFASNDINEDGQVDWRDIDPLVGVMGTICD